MIIPKHTSFIHTECLGISCVTSMAVGRPRFLGGYSLPLDKNTRIFDGRMKSGQQSIKKVSLCRACGHFNIAYTLCYSINIPVLPGNTCTSKYL